MDYSDDSCLDHFTEEQKKRMDDMWRTYRSIATLPPTTSSPTTPKPTTSKPTTSKPTTLSPTLSPSISTSGGSKANKSSKSKIKAAKTAKPSKSDNESLSSMAEQMMKETNLTVVPVTEGGRYKEDEFSMVMSPKSQVYRKRIRQHAKRQSDVEGATNAVPFDLPEEER